jgi:serine/threonine-protein kinase
MADDPRHRPDSSGDRLEPGADRADWELLESTGDLDSSTRRSLKDLERIAAFSRELQRMAPGDSPTEAPPAFIAPPFERWRDLTLLEPIGAGAWGEVWRAYDVTLQRQVALKFLASSGGGRDAHASADLLNEARALARVRHPNIVTVFGIAEDLGRVGMWMECVPGITLAREIERLGALPAHRVAQIGLQLCSALEALDAAGLVHRDIKPANILVEGEDRVVLTDFGLGWRAELDHAEASKSSGTPLFMAPEVLAGGKPTHQGDLYSLGVTLWWSLAGESPFAARTLGELRREAARGPSQSLHSRCPRARRGLIDAILGAMKPAPSERVRSAAELTARLRPFATGAAESASIAVLPFANRSASADDEYLSDGLADELLSVLSKIKGLRVTARTSSFHFKGKDTATAEIGSALNVATLLEGSVRKAGNRIRVSVNLVQVSDSSHLWSETYDRTLEDLFAMQDDIAQSVVKKLRTTLLGEEADSGSIRNANAEVAQAAKGRGTDPEAHRLYLLARHQRDILTREGTERAIGYLKEALARDAGYALAWSLLAGAYTTQAGFGWVPVAEGYGRAREAVERALWLHPDLAEAHGRMGWIRMVYDWDFRGAEASYARALELPPGSAHQGAGNLARTLGRLEQSIELHQRAAEQDPLSAVTYQSLWFVFQAAGRFAEAEAACRRTLELAPESARTYAYLSLTLAALGRGEEALAEVLHESDEAFRLWALAMVHHGLGHAAESDAALQELIETQSEEAAFQVAEVYGARGEVDRAFEWLERAYAQRDGGLTQVKPSAPLRSLHGDPRWGVFLKKMGLEDESHARPRSESA